MQKLRTTLFLGMAVLSLTWAVTAQEKSAEELIAALKKIETFQANFSQKIRDASGEHIAKSQGEVTISRPNKFYWKSNEPDPILVVADGKFLWTYDIDLQQITQQELNKALKNSPATLLAGSLNRLTEEFIINKAPNRQCQKNTDTCYRLTPRQQDATFADIIIGFVKDNLVEIRMHDPLGQDIHTLFTAVTINGKVNPSLFKFHPPAGVDVIQAGN